MPIFNVFEEVLNYDYHDIEDYTIYLAKFEDSVETQIFVGANLAVVWSTLEKMRFAFHSS